MPNYLMILNCLLFSQIKADKSTENGQLFNVKGGDINNLGCTSEPKEHFVGTFAKDKLTCTSIKKYLGMRKRESEVSIF
jgi:hypothetical protein